MQVQEVIAIIAKTLDVGQEEVQSSVALYDSVGVDSTEMVEISLAIAKAAGVTLAPGEINNKHTPEAIADIVAKKK